MCRKGDLVTKERADPLVAFSTIPNSLSIVALPCSLILLRGLDCVLSL